MKKDVLLLADAFEKLFDMCLKFCNLDHCHYFSSPGLNWDAMLKMTGVELEKNWDIDMYLFIEKPTNENTNKRTKNNKCNNFSRMKTSKRRKIGCFAHQASCTLKTVPAVSLCLQCHCDLLVFQIWAKIHLPNDL